eukprot:TRINITY_DN14998_c0_g1_i1.p1 TRINITY_DN14998_c0_g1~~TRINITY_DN14998_c0_g1_i1.p1  ORF type:complete len:314 (+),score=17.48 TRINITY_DN14998_c0_g1_i1:93-1034(+)
MSFTPHRSFGARCVRCREETGWGSWAVRGDTLRCMGCQGIGHTHENCTSEPRCRACVDRATKQCGRCGGVGHTEDVCPTPVCEWCYGIGHAREGCPLWQERTLKYTLPGMPLELLGVWTKRARQGVELAAVDEGSPAYLAGLRRGAVVLRCNHVTMAEPSSFTKVAKHCALTRRKLELIVRPPPEYARKAETSLPAGGTNTTPPPSAMHRDVPADTSDGAGRQVRSGSGVMHQQPATAAARQTGRVYHYVEDPITGAGLKGFQNKQKQDFRPQLVAGLRPGRRKSIESKERLPETAGGAASNPLVKLGIGHTK